MTIASVIFHIQNRTTEQVEAALDGVFAREERPQALRVEGSYTAVLARVDDAALDAAYRYLLLRPHGVGAWTPLLELGSRTEGLDVELSRALDGATIVTVYQYGEVVSGYCVTRAGAEVDRYSSDPTAFDGAQDDASDAEPAARRATKMSWWTSLTACAVSRSRWNSGRQTTIPSPKTWKTCQTS